MNGPLAEEIWTTESNYKAEKETPPGAGASAEEPKAYKCECNDSPISFFKAD